MKRRLILLLASVLLPILSFAQDNAEKVEMGFDQKIDSWFGAATGWFVNIIFYQIPFTEDVQIFWVLFPLILGAMYFTFYFKLINFRGFFTSVNIVRGKYDELESNHKVDVSNAVSTSGGDNPDTIRVEGEHSGEVSHFQALTAALSATVGLGNIAGVAIALSLGGPGATFWMILAGFLGMASKFVECTLGVKYRDIAADGTVYGGPMYYLSKGLKLKGMGGLGKVLAVIFAVMCIGGSFGGGNMFQVNQAYQLVEHMTQTDVASDNLAEGKYLNLPSDVYANKFIEKFGTTYSVDKIEEDVYYLSNAKTSAAVSISKEELEADKGMSFITRSVVGSQVQLPNNYLSALNAGNEGKNFVVSAINGDQVSVKSLATNHEVTFANSELISSTAKVNRLYGYGWLFGLIMAIIVGIVIIGGIKSIASVTDKIVPFMVAIYCAAAIFILAMNYDMIGNAFGQIFNGAFSPEGIAGGFIGVLIQGFRRAAFSNEAGIGSASIAHSAVKTDHPASEGMVALLEPFIDTVVVCTMTALVLIITGSLTGAGPSNDAEAILMTSGAFGSAISWFPYVLTVAVILFAFSTMISWSYYGYQAWAYLFGRTKTNEYIYKLLFCCFVVVGSAATLNSVLAFSDAMIFAMMVPNMIGLVILAPKVKEELAKYMKVIGKKF